MGIDEIEDTPMIDLPHFGEPPIEAVDGGEMTAEEFIWSNN